MKSLTHKLVFFFSVLVVVIAIISGWFSHQQIQQLLVERAFDDLTLQMHGKVRGFTRGYEESTNEVLFLASAPAVRGMLRAKKAHGADPLDGSREQVLRIRLAKLFQEFMLRHPDTFQIRLIGSSPEGKEWVRVEMQEKQPVVIPQNQLQSKGHRDYVKQTLALKQGQIHFSSLDLNREHGKVVKPHMPTLRIATPVYYDGQSEALLVINKHVGPALDQFSRDFPWQGQLYLVEPDQLSYLYHPDKAKQFGKELGHSWRLGSEFSEWAKNISSLQTVMDGDRVSSFEEGDKLTHMSWFELGKGQELGLIYSVSREQILGPFQEMPRRNLFVTLGLMMLAMVGVVLFARSVTSPLRHLAEVMFHYGQGESRPLKLSPRGDEVGRMAETFVEMRRGIEARTQALEEEEKRLNSVFDSAVDGILIINSQGVVERYNQGAVKLFGYESEEVLGQNVSILMGAQLAAEHDGYILRFLREGGDRVVGSSREVEACNKQGEALPIQLSVSHFRYGGEDFFTGICHDLRQQYWLQAALKKANEHLEQEVAERTADLTQANQALTQESSEHQGTQAKLFLVNQIIAKARQAIVITNADNKIMDVNPAYEELTGFSKAQVLGQDPAVGKSGRHDAAFYGRMWQGLVDHNHWEGEVWDRRSDGSIYPKYLSIDRILDNEGTVLNYVAMFQDLTEQKATEEELERLSHYDQLTGLPNRALFRNRLEHEFMVADRHDKSVALVLINLDRFKQINDSFGFTVGDKLLAEVAKRLEQLVRKTDLIARRENRQERDSDTISRLGGDEFSIILAELRAAEDAAIVARRTVALLEEPYEIEGQEVFLGGSLGISIYPQNAESLNGMIQCAERALGKAKEGGRGTFRFYSEEMNRHSAEQVRLETELRRAVHEEKFKLFYQPKLELATGRVEGIEALIRWPHSDGGMVSPAEFIPLTEETGLIVPLGRWILQQACADAVALNKHREHPLRVAVNLSAKQFQQEDLAQVVLRVMDETGIDAAQLELEVTESMVMGNVDEAINTMSILKGLGLTLSIDDFGTGYSSLSYLKRFPVDALKVDQSFVRDLEVDSEDAAIVHAVCNLGESLGMKVVAEGIETQQQMDFLKQLNCETGQGFFIAKPMPIEALKEFLKRYEEGAA
ncbi:bifunctional diguanylate cyclase/phosphodiesterase [Magnetococcus sp. PR-3]|uniref:bifunctional diguanylate cyclase/phosphodiesterase n=1 Tax=Magnetococcus sp. PR-3 TaxID=3120355 RepID=UPI002FCDE650